MTNYENLRQRLENALTNLKTSNIDQLQKEHNIYVKIFKSLHRMQATIQKSQQKVLNKTVLSKNNSFYEFDRLKNVAKMFLKNIKLAIRNNMAYLNQKRKQENTSLKYGSFIHASTHDRDASNTADNVDCTKNKGFEKRDFGGFYDSYEKDIGVAQPLIGDFPLIDKLSFVGSENKTKSVKHNNYAGNTTKTHTKPSDFFHITERSNVSKRKFSELSNSKQPSESSYNPFKVVDNQGVKKTTLKSDYKYVRRLDNINEGTIYEKKSSKKGEDFGYPNENAQVAETLIMAPLYHHDNTIYALGSEKLARKDNCIFNEGLDNLEAVDREPKDMNMRENSANITNDASLELEKNPIKQSNPKYSGAHAQSEVERCVSLKRAGFDRKKSFQNDLTGLSIIHNEDDDAKIEHKNSACKEASMPPKESNLHKKMQEKLQDVEIEDIVKMMVRLPAKLDSKILSEEVSRINVMSQERKNIHNDSAASSNKISQSPTLPRVSDSATKQKENPNHVSDEKSADVSKKGSHIQKHSSVDSRSVKHELDKFYSASNHINEKKIVYPDLIYKNASLPHSEYHYPNTPHIALAGDPKTKSVPMFSEVEPFDIENDLCVNKDIRNFEDSSEYKLNFSKCENETQNVSQENDHLNSYESAKMVRRPLGSRNSNQKSPKSSRNVNKINLSNKRFHDTKQHIHEALHQNRENNSQFNKKEPEHPVKENIIDNLEDKNYMLTPIDNNLLNNNKEPDNLQSHTNYSHRNDSLQSNQQNLSIQQSLHTENGDIGSSETEKSLHKDDQKLQHYKKLFKEFLEEKRLKVKSSQNDAIFDSLTKEISDLKFLKQKMSKEKTCHKLVNDDNTKKLIGQNLIVDSEASMVQQINQKIDNVKSQESLRKSEFLFSNASKSYMKSICAENNYRDERILNDTNYLYTTSNPNPNYHSNDSTLKSIVPRDLTQKNRDPQIIENTRSSTKLEGENLSNISKTNEQNTAEKYLKSSFPELHSTENTNTATTRSNFDFNPSVAVNMSSYEGDQTQTTSEQLFTFRDTDASKNPSDLMSYSEVLKKSLVILDATNELQNYNNNASQFHNSSLRPQIDSENQENDDYDCKKSLMKRIEYLLKTISHINHVSAEKYITHLQSKLQTALDNPNLTKEIQSTSLIEKNQQQILSTTVLNEKTRVLRYLKTIAKICLRSDKAFSQQYFKKGIGNSLNKMQLSISDTRNMIAEKILVDLEGILAQGSLQDDIRFVKKLEKLLKDIDNFETPRFFKISVQLAIAKKYVGDIVTLKKKNLIRRYYDAKYP